MWGVHLQGRFYKLPPRRKVDQKIEVVPGLEPPSKAPYRVNLRELFGIREATQ